MLDIEFESSLENLESYSEIIIQKNELNCSDSDEAYDNDKNYEVKTISESLQKNEVSGKFLAKYDHVKKLELVKKINKIKKKEYLINIFKIINSSSKDFSENNNGIFIFFHNLSDEIYEKLETYVNLIYKIHQQSCIKNIYMSDVSDSLIITSDMNDEENNEKNDEQNGKELSNKEKMLMRRKKYEEYLTYNQNK